VLNGQGGYSSNVPVASQLFPQPGLSANVPVASQVFPQPGLSANVPAPSQSMIPKGHWEEEEVTVKRKKWVSDGYEVVR